MKNVAKRKGRKPRNKSQKFLPSFLTVAARLLEEGMYPAKIAKLLNISKQRLYYWLNKLTRAGIFYKEKLGRITRYYLTDYGKKFFTRCEGRARFGLVRLHNVCFKFPIVSPPRVPVDWRRVSMRNWARFIGKVGEVTVECTTRHVLIYPRVRVDRDPYRALLKAYEEALLVARVLEEKFQMRLGLPEINRKPHFGFYDPVAQEIARHTQVSTDIGKIDASEGRGENEYFSAEWSAEYQAMPMRLRRIEESLSQLISVVEKISSLFEKLILPLTMKPKPGAGDRYVT